MNPAEAFAADRRLILDGGTGSELRRRGIALSTTAWSAAANLTHSEMLTQIHADYIRAGADIVTANTFATSRFVLAGAGLESRFAEINFAAIRAAQAAADAAGRGTLVAASLSCLPPRFDVGHYPAPRLEYRGYAELAECFATLGVDLVLIEMLEHPQHAALACRAVAAAGLTYCAGISARLAANGSESVPGPALVAYDDSSIPLGAVLDAILQHSPDAIAVMHSPLDAMAQALSAVRAVWSGPVGAYAEIPYPVNAAHYVDEARRWLDLGAGLIGGCCGTTPEHIAALRKMLDGSGAEQR